MRSKRTIAGLFIVIPLVGNAQNEAKSNTLKNETELSIVSIAGNAEGTTYSGKQDTSYAFDLNKFALGGRYQQVFATNPSVTPQVSQETARNWLVNFRYERELMIKFSIFAQQSAESDIFAGFDQRYNTDFGGKYSLWKDATTEWVGEAGYRYTSEFRTVATAKVPNTDVRLQFARIYTKATHKLAETTSIDLWVEYLPNFTNSNDYMTNGEISLTAQLSSTFSLKTGYLMRYRNTLVGSATRYSDTSFTTAIVARY